MKYLSTFLLSLVLGLSAYANGVDSLHFHSPLEKQAFKSLKSGEMTLDKKIALLYAIDSLKTDEDVNAILPEIMSMVKYLESKYKPGKYKRYSKKVFQLVQDKYFKKFQGMSSFPELMETGEFNCASGTALFALVTEELRIPYEIREQPNHVYLVIDPESSSIVLESTDPQNGVFKLQKADYVQMLIDSKMISEEEARGKPVNELYNSYLGDVERSVTLLELAGDLYHNAALRAAMDENFQQAHNLIGKAIYLNNSKQSQAVRLSLLLSIFNEIEIQDPDYPRYLSELMSLEEWRETATENVSNDLIQYSQDQLIGAGRFDNYVDIYRRIEPIIREKAKEEQLSKFHLVHHGAIMGEYYRMKEDWGLVTAHLDTAYSLFPNDLRVQYDLAYGVNYQLYQLTYDPEKMAEEIHIAEEKYPFLAENEKFLTLKLLQKGIVTSQAFMEDKSTAGFESFEDFNSLLDQVSFNEFVQDIIGTVYGQISGYFIRHRQETKGKDWIIKGLKLAPECKELQGRLTNFEEYELKYKR